MRSTVEEILASYERPIGLDAARRVDGVMQLDITGDGGGAYYFDVHEGTLLVRKGRHEAPTTTVAVEIDDFLRISRGTSTVFELAVEGRLRVSGSLQLANRFRSMLLGSL